MQVFLEKAGSKPTWPCIALIKFLKYLKSLIYPKPGTCTFLCVHRHLGDFARVAIYETHLTTDSIFSWAVSSFPVLLGNEMLSYKTKCGDFSLMPGTLFLSDCPQGFARARQQTHLKEDRRNQREPGNCSMAVGRS
jgi:hypothetical protein